MEYLDRRPSNWVSTVLQSIGGTLIGILLVWIAGNQVTIGKAQAVLQRDFVAQADLMTRYINAAERDTDEVKEWMAQIWPRLRTHGENVELLRNEVEDICKCKIILKRPEDF